MIKDKIITDLKADIVIERNGMKIGFTNGCFDILHVGHVRYLEETKKYCDVLVVGVNSNASVKRLKGDARPINSENARMQVLAALESVDVVILFEEDTPLDLIKRVMPDVLFKGGDWAEEDIVGADVVKSSGGRVKVIEFVEGFSTTNTIEKMKGK